MPTQRSQLSVIALLSALPYVANCFVVVGKSGGAHQRGGFGEFSGSSMQAVVESPSRTEITSTATTTTTSSSLSSSQDTRRSSTAIGYHDSRHLGYSSKSNNDVVMPDTKSLGTLTVPSVGVGTISWSSDSLSSLENDKLQHVVSTARELNGAFFDTAERYGSHWKTAFGLGYGETEKLTQKLLQQTDEKSETTKSLLRPIVATKFTPTPWRTTVQDVVDACEQSRKNLGVDQIDLYQIHMSDIVQPLNKFLGHTVQESKNEIYWDGLAECYNRGLVKNVGVCNYGPTLTMQCQEALAKRGVPLASNQIAYSLIGRHGGAQETLEKCQELGIEVLAFFPYAMGLLTGKYSSSKTNQGHDSSLHSHSKTLLEVKDLQRYASGDGGKTIPQGGIDPLLQVMETIAAQRQKTVAQVALNYIICKGAIPIPGARTVGQLRDNAGAMGWRLTPSEVELLEQTADNLGIGFEGAGFKRTSEKFVGYGVEKWRLD